MAASGRSIPSGCAVRPRHYVETVYQSHILVGFENTSSAVEKAEDKSAFDVRSPDGEHKYVGS
jgi:hypothetical protein